jgi:hypothetical protein
MKIARPPAPDAAAPPAPPAPFAAALATALLAACASFQPPPAPDKPIAPMSGLGRSTFEVTARDEQARAWFAQGLLLTYAFEQREAARVFRAAAARDPSCAMCAWGVAYALGPNINNPDRGPAAEIRHYIEQARRAAAAAATPVERALIEAMAVRYGRAEPREQRDYEAQGAALCSARKSAGAEGDEPRPVDPQELGYAAAMADVVRKYPDHPDVVTLYADAVMTTMPWAWWDRKTGRPNGATADAIERLRATTARHPRHTGALHFFVHIAEHSPDPRQAEAAADALDKEAPGAPHLVHMGSHVYKNIGRFADGSRANEQALAVQKTFDAALKAQGVEVRGNWDGHHLHFLWYAALMEGRTDLSLRTARDIARRGANRGDGGGEYARMLPLVTLVRLQQWDEVLAEPLPPEGLGLHEGYAAHARGMAFASTGRLAQARAELARLAQLREQPTLKRARLYGEPLPQKMLAVAHGVLAGAIARAERRHDAAITALRAAAEVDDELGSDPPLLGGGARLALAGALLGAGRAADADKELAEVLRVHGPSAWTHQGAAQLARLRGAAADSERSAELARTAWKAAERARLPVL